MTRIKRRRYIIMDLQLALVIQETLPHEIGVIYTRDPYQQDRAAYYEAERVLREAGEL